MQSNLQHRSSTSVRRRRAASSSNLLAGASLVALVAIGAALPEAAWAAGGNSLSTLTGRGGTGGIDGSLASATGQNSSDSTTGAGGGGVDLTTGNGAPGGQRILTSGTAGATGAAGQIVTAPASLSTTIAGGIGGAGSDTNQGGGGGGVGVRAGADVTVTGTGAVTGGAGFAKLGNAAGGGGGVGVFSSANVTVAAGGRVAGGAGGGVPSMGGGGGGGAAAIVLTNGGTVQNSGTLTGGVGGQTNFSGGGDGGAGVQLLAGGTVINTASGVITGGAGGVGRVNTVGSGTSPGRGGAGIEGANLTIVNAGAITGGAGGTGTGWTPVAGQAIQFTGGVNSLEIQAGSTITGNVAAFSTADTLKLGGDTNSSFDVSAIGPAAQYQGFGLYEKTGAGAWTLTGATTAVTPWTVTSGVLSVSSDASLGDPSGAVTFNGGTLQFGSALSSARAMTVNANGGVIDTQGNTDTLSGVISGSGALTKIGSGALVLTGANAYAGGTTISAGTLQLGDGGTSGGIVGDVANNGALAFDRSDATTFGGMISGSGAVQQIGAGATTLTGANTYAGGTTISAGTLTGSATSFGAGAILDNGALVIAQPADADFANPINGSGVFTKQGAGRLNLTGSNGFSGPTTVAGGTLAVNGSLANSAVTVQSGGVLAGAGTVGATTIQSGGAVAPGNSIGTLHVNGAFAQQAGSTYQVQVDPASSASDLISVSGAATLAPGAGLNVSRIAPGDYRPGTTYTVLDAAGGRTGTYVLGGDTTSVSAFLGLRDTYDANHAYLTVVQTRDPASAAQTPNQVGAAGAVDALPITAPVRTGVLNLPSDGAARGAFDQLSGDALASAKGMLVSSSVLVRDVTLDRLRDVFCGGPDAAAHQGNASSRPSACAAASDRPTAWAQGFGDWSHVDGAASAAGVSQTTGGVLMGLDIPVQAWRAGLFGGYSRTDFDVDARDSSGGSDSYHLGAYAGRQWGGLGLRLGASYTWNDISTERRVAFGNFADQLSADYRAGSTQVFGELGQRFTAGRFDLEPFVGAAYVNLQTAGFGETGGPAALSTRGDTTEDTFTTLGMRPSTTVQIGPVEAVLRGMAGWRHTFGDVAPTSTVSFAGGDAFSVSGAPLARDAGVVEVGLDFAVIGGARASLTYGGQFSDRQTDNSVRASFTAHF
jgi:outer membrane autotransporter protein